MDDFLHRRPLSFLLWIRKTAYERLLMLRRRQRGQQARLQGKSPTSQRWSFPAQQLLAAGASLSEHLQARELARLLAGVVARLSARDREMLLMRQVERLPYEEIACLLEIEAATARKRYGRALLRLRQALIDAGLLEV